MIKKLLGLGVASLLFLGNPTQPVLANEQSSEEQTTSSEIVTSSEEQTTSSEEELVSSEEITSSEDGGLIDVIKEPLAQLENIIVALFVSFTGTGTVAFIVRGALSKLTKQMSKKVTDAEAQNKISIEQSQKSIQQILDFENILKTQVSDLDKTVKDLIQNQNITNENIKMIIEEYKQRDEQIKDLITKEFSDEINE
jgi:hypothetical protein